MMSNEILNLLPKIIKKFKFKTIDITGGAPELHPKFRALIRTLYKLDIEIIDRCNLTILFEEGNSDLANFLAENKVKIVASLPCYIKNNVDKQRGNNVFIRSIKGLKLLNSLGYGMRGTNLTLDLVYNPLFDTLPPPQNQLEKEYKDILLKNYGIEFNNLYTITNMPINRFKHLLKTQNRFNSYMNLLHSNYNSKTLKSLMCKNTISINWNGDIYDCDFNQQLKLENKYGARNIYDLLNADFVFKGNEISVGSHCFACTAGNGSSCSGSLEESKKIA
tara:strand:- start:6257 stop:7087 length:831 start_codon:yes stop_codon:yes gene_type:complete